MVWYYNADTIICYSCIQKHCLKTILHMKVSKCPLCNNRISKKDIKLIYKKPSILSL